ncbi:MAG: hypothetical protein GVY30_05060, partial [Chloroflexi bacterium]|nr:hypothetical protein [Chloroflexota bacterium]
FTPTNPDLGGAFAGQSPTVDKAGEVVTFTFASDLELDDVGTISFPLWRVCGNDGALSAAVSYQDLCDTPRSASDTGGETSRVSNVHLFVTPQDATINERETRWRFYVYNTGSLPATPIITNTLPAGYVFYTYTVASATAPGILDSVTLVTNTVGGQQILTFTLPGLAQDEQVQFDVYANIESQCAPVSPVKIKLKQACGQVEGVCGDSPDGERVIKFASGTASINSSNDQTTGLPLCEIGQVQLLVKNTSPQSQIFDFTITEVITNGSFVTGTSQVTVTNRAGQVVSGATSEVLLQNIPFTPTVATVGNTQILTWTVGDFAPGNPAYDVLAQREAGDLMLLTFGLQTGCEGLEAQAQSGGAARDVCENEFGFGEDSQTLVVDAPELTVVKTGCNDTVKDCSEAGNFTEEVFAGADEVVVWKIDVFNDGPQDALNLYVDDIIPANFTLSETNPLATSMVGDMVSWEITNTTTALAAEGGHTTFYITGTVDTNGCVDSTLITVTAGFGCTSAGDSCSSADVSDIASLRNEPAITLDARDLSISQCGGGPVRVLITNDGAYAKDFVISYTLPSALAYDGDAGSSPSPDVYPALGATGVITWRYATLTDAAELHFNVENQAGVCPAPGQLTGTADGRYLDSCGVAFDDIDADDATITVHAPSIEGNLTGGAAQLPITRAVTAGEVVTWAISLRNSGSWPGHARNVVITETFGSGYESIAGSVSTGSGGGDGVTPVVAGQTITWDVGTLNAGGAFNAIITATVLDAPDQLRLTLEAHSECDNGECSWDMSPAYYATALQDFTKTASVSDIPIGQPFSYTITADFFGAYTYTDLVLTDTLPTLDGQLVFSVTEVVTANANGANVWQVGALAGPQLVFDTASGDVTGPEHITFTITGVVSNSAAADNGDSLNNAIALAYVDDTPRYFFTESEAVTVSEPTLNIDKTTSASGPVQAGDRVTYTLDVSHAPASTADAHDLELTDVIPDDLTLVSGSLQSNPAANSVATTSQSITLTYQAFPLTSAPLVITYAVTVDLNAEPSSNLFNNAQVLWTSTATDPFGEERTGEGGVDDYIAGVQTPVETGDPEIIKYLLGPTEYTIGDLITYTAKMSLPAGRARDVVLSDTLPTGLVYQAGSSELTGPGISSPGTPPTVNGPNDGIDTTTLRWDLGTLTSTPGSLVPVVVTFTVALTDVGANQRPQTRDNDIEAAWLNDQDV